MRVERGQWYSLRGASFTTTVQAVIPLVVGSEEELRRIDPVADRNAMEPNVTEAIRPDVSFQQPEVVGRRLEGVNLAAAAEEKSGDDRVPPDVGPEIYEYSIVP
jgi:hypothetical protein